MTGQTARLWPPLVTLLTLLHTHHVTCYHGNATSQPLALTRLYKHVIEPYHRVQRPVRHPSTPTNVSIRLNFLHLIDVNEITSTITVNLWLQIFWQDEIRFWNPDDYDGIDLIHVGLNDVWRPTFLDINSNDERFLFENDASSLYITNDGRSFWYPGKTVSTACGLDLSKFPFDSQACELSLLSRDFDQDMVFSGTEVERHDVGVEAVLNLEWNVVDVRPLPIHRIPGGVADKHVSRADFEVKLSRVPGFYVINLILPVNLLTLLSLLPFIIPDDSGEKISYSVTLLLSTGIYLSTVTSVLPVTSQNMPMVMIYLFVLHLYCSLAMVVSVVTMIWRRKYVTDNKVDVSARPSSELHAKDTVRRSQFDGSFFTHKTKTGNDGLLQGRRMNAHEMNSFVGGRNVEELNERGCSVGGEGNGRGKSERKFLVRENPRFQGFGSESKGGSDGQRGCCDRKKERFVSRLDAIIIALFLVAWVVITAVFIAMMMS